MEERFYFIESLNSSKDNRFAGKSQSNGKPYYYFGRLDEAIKWKTSGGAERVLNNLISENSQLSLKVVGLTNQEIEKVRIEREEESVIANINLLRDNLKYELVTYNIKCLAYAEEMANLKPGDDVYLSENWQEDTKPKTAKVDSISGHTVVVGGYNFSRLSGKCKDGGEMTLAQIFPVNEAIWYFQNFALISSMINNWDELSEDQINRIASIIREK